MRKCWIRSRPNRPPCLREVESDAVGSTIELASEVRVALTDESERLAQSAHELE